MVGKQRTAKAKKKSSNNRDRTRGEADHSRNSNGREVFTSVDEAIEVFATSKQDVKRLLELKFAYFEYSVWAFSQGIYALSVPAKCNDHDTISAQVIKEMYILDNAVEMQQRTFYGMAQEVLGQHLKPSLDLHRKIQKLITESNDLIQVQLYIDNIDKMLKALCKSAEEMEKETRRICERRSKSKNMVNLQAYNC